MLMLWWLAGAALVVSVAALWTARRAAHRLELLTQSYWEMRYEFTSLRNAGAVAAADTQTPSSQSGSTPGGAQTSFVSLSSLKSDAGKVAAAAKAGNGE